MTFAPAIPMPFAHESYLGRPSCPRCGEAMIAAETTVVTPDGASARHLWHCDACDHEFVTTVRTGRS